MPRLTGFELRRRIEAQHALNSATDRARSHFRGRLYQFTSGCR
jgi:hypothetical protein